MYQLLRLQKKMNRKYASIYHFLNPKKESSPIRKRGKIQHKDYLIKWVSDSNPLAGRCLELQFKKMSDEDIAKKLGIKLAQLPYLKQRLEKHIQKYVSLMSALTGFLPSALNFNE